MMLPPPPRRHFVAARQRMLYGCLTLHASFALLIDTRAVACLFDYARRAMSVHAMRFTRAAPFAAC